MQRPRASVGIDQKVARIVTPHDGLLPDELGRPRVVDLHDAGSRLLRSHTHLFSNTRDGGESHLVVEGHAPAQEAFR